MDPKSPAEQPKKLPPQVEQMLASAKEMEAILTKKLAVIDVVSKEKSEMAKQEAFKIKSDVEEIKRLSLVQTKEGEQALRAKIMEVNQRIEATTRKAAELQENAVDSYKQTLDEIREITNGLLKVLAIDKTKMSQDDANLVLNRVLTFEKHAALRTDYSLKLLQDIRRLVMNKVDVCSAVFVDKKQLMNSVEYVAKLLNSLCPGTIRHKAHCPAAVIRRRQRPKSQ